MNRIFNLDMSVNDLAEFVFIKNVNDSRLNLSLEGIEDTYDLFCFCVDLLCKGLVLLYGNNGRVEIDDMSADNLTHISKKMKNAGILLSLSIEEKNLNNTFPRMVTFLKPENDMNTKLELYSMHIQGKDKVYNVNFGLCHNV